MQSGIDFDEKKITDLTKDVSSPKDFSHRFICLPYDKLGYNMPSKTLKVVYYAPILLNILQKCV